MLSREENCKRHSLRIQAQYKKHKKILSEFRASYIDKSEYDFSTGRYNIPADIEIYYKHKLYMSALEIFFLLIKKPVRYDFFEIKRKKKGLTKEQYIRIFYEEQKKERFLSALLQRDSHYADFYSESFNKDIDEDKESKDLKKFRKFAYPNYKHFKSDDYWEDEIERERVNTLKKDLKLFDDWEGGRGRSPEDDERRERDDMFSDY